VPFPILADRGIPPRVGRVVEASERRHMRLVLSIHVALSISCDRQDYQPGQRKSDDARRDVLVLAAALARPYPNMCWHRLLPWLLNRLQEKPLEVGRGAQLLSRLFRQISWEGIAAIPRTVPLLAEPAASIGDEPNTAIAIWICAFHDTFLLRPLRGDIVMCDPPRRHRVSQ
jgi:hypothetical protein